MQAGERSGTESSVARLKASGYEFVRHPKARRYIIRVAENGVVRVTLPRWGSKREAEAFAERERVWIEKQQRRAEAERERRERERHRRTTDGELAERPLDRKSVV